jgi:hypothetical protein
VLHYAFDDTVTTDSSGNSNTGVLSGSPLPSLVPGRIGNALSFSGGSGGGYVAFTSVAQLGLASNTSPISVSAWVKTTATDGCILSLRHSVDLQTLIDFVVGATGLGNIATGLPAVIIRDDAGVGVTSIVASTVVNDGNLHHVCYTRDITQYNRIYVDGVLSGGPTLDGLTSGITPNVAGSAIGAELNNLTLPFFNGVIDDFQIYNRTLSSTEVAQIYAVGVGTNAVGNSTAASPSTTLADFERIGIPKSLFL